MSTPDEAAEAAADALSAAISGPRRVRGEGGEVEQHDLDQLIEAEKYQRSKCAATGPRRGLRITQLKPPGAV